MTYRDLLDIIIRNGNVDGLTAKSVADYYRKHKLVKWNAHDGYQAVHGGLFDRPVILRTVDVIQA